MANEIKVTTGLACTNGTFILPSTARTVSFDQATSGGGGPGSVDVGTTEETIDFGDITPGWVEFINTDSTNYVQLGFSTGVYGIRLLAGGGKALYYAESGSTVYVKANTAACRVTVNALEA